MKNLKVTVNGKIYDVQVEEVSDSVSVQNSPVSPTPAVSQPAPAPTPVSTPAATASGQPVDSPMPGTILDIKVSKGQKVSKGETLLILEAMKMENEIVSPKDAVVSDIKVSKGQNVDSGTPLVFLA